MKISPISAPSNSNYSQDQGPAQPQVRSLKMNTNATPEWQRPVAQVQDLPPAAPKHPNHNQNEDQDNADEVTQPLSPQFAALAKERRALQVMKKQLEDERKAFTEPGQGNVDLARLKSEPMRVLLENGVTYEQLTEAILANPGNPEIYELKKKLQELESGFDEKLSARDQQAQKQVLAEISREVKGLAEGEEFELIRGMNRADDVVKLIERNFKETGEVLGTREAMQLIEDELMKDIDKYTGFKKVQTKFASPHSQMQSHQQGMRTLTNRDTANAPMSAKQRAMAAFYGQLK